jgi:signal transduction histidine kinase
VFFNNGWLGRLYSCLAIVLCLEAGAKEPAQKPARIVTQYALTADDDYQSNDPKDWQLLGSNDEGKTWALLDRQMDQTFAERSQRRVFTITNLVAYNTFRLQVDRAFGSADQVEIAEIELLGPVVGVANEAALDVTVTASLEHPLMGPAFQAFDGDVTTKWWDFGLGRSNMSWIQCQYTLHSDRMVTNINQLVLAARHAAIENPLLDKTPMILSNLTTQAAKTSRALTGYALTSANDTPTRDPRDWRLLGSRDGSKTWDTLDIRQNEVFSARHQRRMFTLANVADYPIFRLQIDSVADVAGELTDSVQLAEIEPLYPASETGKAAAGYGMVVSAQGEHPPWETCEQAFDDDPTSKWLDFAYGHTNRSSWIQWQYVRGMDGLVANLNRLRAAPRASSRPVKLTLDGVVVYRDAANDLGVLDATGCELVRLRSPVEGVRFGDRIHLKGNLQFGSHQTSVSAPELTSFGPVPAVDQIRPGQAFSKQAGFLLAEADGQADMILPGNFYSNIQLTSKDGHDHIQAKIPNPEHAGLGGLSGCRLHVRGVAEPVFNQNGQRVAGVVWTSGFDQVSLMPPTDQEWSGWPEYAITNLSRPGAPWGSVVRVRGQANVQNPGLGVVISQNTNRLAVELHQPLDVPGGSTIECAGLLGREGSEPVLRMACFRPVSTDDMAQPEPPRVVDDSEGPVTEMHQLLELTARHPDKTYAFKIRGVITYIDDRLGGFYVQSGPDGTQVDAQMRAGLSANVGQEGMFVELRGSAYGAWLRPEDFVTILGKGTMPEPKRPSWDELSSGKDDDRWVEVKGVVTAVKTQLTVMVDGREMVVWVNKMDRQSLKNLLGSLVRIRGVCSGVLNSRNQRLGERLLVSSDENIEVLHAAPENPLDLPTVPVGQLMQSAPDSTEQTIRFIKTAGVVTYAGADQLFLQDGEAGLRVVPQQAMELAAGDQVEAAGLETADGLSPMLIQALVRKLGHTALPAGKEINLLGIGSGIQENLDAARVRIEATYLGSSFDGTAQVLELQHDRPKKTFYAYLPATEDSRLPFDAGSKLRLVGVFKGKTEAAADYGQLTTSFEIFLNTVSDITVLQRPPWWTAQHAFWILGGLAAVLTMALAWGATLRKRVQVQTEVIKRNHQKLLAVSRQAGMAEVATSVLHNVGNVLNSVNVSATLLTDNTKKSKVPYLGKIVALLDDHAADLGPFMTGDPKGRQLPGFLSQVAGQLVREQQNALQELELLRQNIEHIKDIVAMQQSYAKISGVTETVTVTDLAEDALRMNAGALSRHEIKVVREYGDVPPIVVEKHKVLQILVNLIRNAKYACDDSRRPDKQIRLRVAPADHGVWISVIDNGVGIPRENLTRIFNLGFTTRKGGHGFGLNSGASAAKELGGSLVAQSDGSGLGASFTLKLPLRPPKAAA